MSTLHITNGSSAGDTLQTFVDGQVVLTHDVLHEGPAPHVEGDAWHATRARFLADTYDPNVDAIRADLARVDRTIADQARSASLSGDRDAIVLWFEHDLFDQLQLIRNLDLLVRLKADTTYGNAGDTTSVASGFSRTVSLICIDRFPGVERFIGLGQLTADQLASLYPSRKPVTAGQYAIASEAWDAFRSPDPMALVALALRLTPPFESLRAALSSVEGPDTTVDAATVVDGVPNGLPFLRDAVLRLLAEYPSTTNGLSRTEQLALRALSEAPMTGGALFAATQRHEPRPFMGDSTFYDIVRGMAAARVPLVDLQQSANGQRDLREEPLAITQAGRDVAAGRRDHVALNGIDRWKGGVHLVGDDRSPWRWDESRETLVS